MIIQALLVQWVAVCQVHPPPLRISFCVAKRRVKLDNYGCFMWFSKVKGLRCGGQLVLAKLEKEMYRWTMGV